MSDANGQPLPPGWALAPIEDLFWPLEDGRTLHQGWSPLCEKTPAPTDEDWGVLKTTAIQAGAFLPQHNKHLPKHLTPRPQTEVKTGDILITCAGPRVRCGVACMVRHTRPRLMMSGKMYRFRVSPDDMDARYLEAFLLTSEATRAIDKMKTGGSDSGLNLTHDRFRPLPVPVAPLNEQRRIMDTVEEVTSDLDAGVAALERVQAKLKHYRAAVLKAAVEGTLTAEWRAKHPATEPASDLLTRILAERRRRWEEAQLKKFKEAGKAPPKDWKAKYKEPAKPDTTNLPPLPEGWFWTNAETTCDFITKGTTPSGTHAPKPEGQVPFIKVQHLSGTGSFHFSDSPSFISSEVNRSGSLARSRVFPHDVLMNLVGPPLGQVSVVPETYPEWNVNQAIAIFRTVPGVWNRFLAISLLARPIIVRALRLTKTTAGQVNLTLEVCRELPLPLPPCVEQEAIVEAVEDQLSVIEHLEADLEAKLKSSRALRRSILRHAFTGQLVPQDPKDEPAAELLKRIAAQREELARQTQAAKKPKLKAPPKRAAKQTRKKHSHD
jgi:type I restriction enzyme S subunit